MKLKHAYTDPNPNPCLSGANELYHEGPHARQRRRGAPVSERARRVNGEYIAKARTLDHEHSRQVDEALPRRA